MTSADPTTRSRCVSCGRRFLYIGWKETIRARFLPSAQNVFPTWIESTMSVCLLIQQRIGFRRGHIPPPKPFPYILSNHKTLLSNKHFHSTRKRKLDIVYPACCLLLPTKGSTPWLFWLSASNVIRLTKAVPDTGNLCRRSRHRYCIEALSIHIKYL